MKKVSLAYKEIIVIFVLFIILVLGYALIKNDVGLFRGSLLPGNYGGERGISSEPSYKPRPTVAPRGGERGISSEPSYKPRPTVKPRGGERGISSEPEFNPRSQEVSR